MSVRISGHSQSVCYRPLTRSLWIPRFLHAREKREPDKICSRAARSLQMPGEAAVTPRSGCLGISKWFSQTCTVPRLICTAWETRDRYYWFTAPQKGLNYLRGGGAGRNLFGLCSQETYIHMYLLQFLTIYVSGLAIYKISWIYLEQQYIFSHLTELFRV